MAAPEKKDPKSKKKIKSQRKEKRERVKKKIGWLRRKCHSMRFSVFFFVIFTFFVSSFLFTSVTSRSRGRSMEKEQGGKKGGA